MWVYIHEDAKKVANKVSRDFNMSVEEFFKPGVEGLSLRADDRISGDIAHIIWLKHPRGDHIVHEVSHTVHNVMRSLGIPLTLETDEVYAYYSAFLVEQIMKKLIKGY